MLNAGKLSLQLFFIFCFSQIVGTGKILFLITEPLSHWRTLYPIAKALQERGHQVTMASLGLKEPTLPMGKIHKQFFTATTSHQELLDLAFYQNSTIMHEMLWNSDTSNVLTLAFTTLFFNSICLETIDQRRADLKKFMERDWDLILVDDMMNACGASMASLSTAKYISYAATITYPGIKFFKGIPHSPAITAPVYHKFHFQPENFWSRVQCILSYSSELFYTAVVSNFATIQAGRSLDPEKYQSFSGFISNSEMLLTDYPNALDYPHPERFDLVETGSFCSSSPKPLPDNFEHFVSDPRSKGTIYMAFGSIVDWNIAPMEKILTFKDAISGMKEYRIFWQYNGPELELPDHVMVQKWFPQADILAHKRTVIFLSHGGLKSLREGMCEGVPMVVMPILAEQLRNALIVKEKKIGIFLDKMTLTADNIEFALRSVLKDTGMRRNMGKMRDYLKDQILDGPQKAAFWSEFLLNHQGVPRLFFSNRSQELWLFQYFMLDVIGGILGFIGISIWLLYMIMKVLYSN